MTLRYRKTKQQQCITGDLPEANTVLLCLELNGKTARILVVDQDTMPVGILPPKLKLFKTQK